jgi:hypothetical protein
MTQETEKIIDEIIARAHTQGGNRYETIMNRYEMRALLRRRAIEAVELQFREGLELSDIGVLLPPGSMIDLIANANESGYPVTW